MTDSPKKEKMVHYRSVKRSKLIGNIIFISFFVLVSFIFLFPLYWMIVSSFKPLPHIFVQPFEWLPRLWYPDNFIRGWQWIGGITFTTLYLNTFYVVFMGIFFTLLTASMSAFAFSRLNFKLRNMWFMIMLSTMMLPSQVTLIPTYMILNFFGLVNTRTVLWFGALWGGGAWNIFMIRQFMLGIPKELDEAAKIDGASIFYIYWRIILPLCKGVLLTITIFQFNGRYSDLMTPLIFVHSARLQTIAPAINAFLDTGGLGSRDLALAMSTLSIMPLIIIFFAVQKRFVQGIQTVGVKG